MMKIKFFINFYFFFLRKSKLEECKSNAPSRIDQLFKIFALHNYFRENITPCKSDALQKYRHTNVTSCNKKRQAKVFSRSNVTLRAKMPLCAKVTPCKSVP